LIKVLYISYDGLTDPLGQSQVLPYLAGLSKTGFHFTILSFEKKDRFLREKNIVSDIVTASGMHWIPLRFTSKPPVLSKIFDRWKLKRTAFRIHKKEKFDLLHCRSYVSAEIGIILKKKFNTKFLFDMRGFWADEKVDNGQWNQNILLYRLLYKYYKRKEKEFLLQADGIVMLTQAGREYLLSEPAYRKLSIDVIPCCADLDYFDYHKISVERVNALKKDMRIPATAKILTYSGSIGGWYLLKEMLSFFKTLIDHEPGYVMLVLTKDPSDVVRSEARQCGIPDEKIFVTYSDREQLSQFLALSTYGIFFIRDTFSKMASSPTKHAELMGMGIPVICNDIGDTGSIVNSTKTGFIVDDFSEQSFQTAIEKINDLARIDKEYIRECAKQRFDLKTGIQAYLNLYHRILN
jgi:glycosyltransferase involved in cell wall biosynthesis